MLPRMGRITTFVLVTLLLAGCSSGTPAAAPPPSPTAPSTSATPTPTSPTTTAPPPFTPLVSPEKVTAACPLLGGTEVTDTIAGSDTYVAVDQPPGKSGSVTGYNCSYQSKRFSGSETLHLTIVVAPRKASPKAMVTGLQKECDGTAVTQLPDIGEAAWTCQPEGTTTLVMTAKSSHGETRVARLEFAAPFRQEVYTKLAKLMADRL